MNFLRLEEAPTAAPAPRRGPPPTAGAAIDAGALVGRVGSEVAEPLTRALDRLHAFASTGRIDRGGLRALCDDIARARRVGLHAQRIAQLGSKPAEVPPSRHGLPQALRDALSRRRHESDARIIEVRQDLQPVEVAIDGALLRELLQALLDWCFDHARSAIDLRVDRNPWPPHARLHARFVHLPPDEPPVPTAAGAALDCVAWGLLVQAARVAGLTVRRDDTAVATCARIDFPLAVDRVAISLDDADAPGAAARAATASLAGRHLLVVAARRDTRNGIRETLRSTGAMVDYVTSVDEARDFCSQAMPHAIVYEASLAGEAFRRSRREWTAAAPALLFVEIAEAGRALEVHELDGEHTVRVGGDVIASALPDALLYEWAQAAA